MTPVWTLQVSCVVYEAYIHNLTTDKESTLNFSSICLVHFQYFNTLSSSPPVIIIRLLNSCSQKWNRLLDTLLDLVLMNNNCATTCFKLLAWYSSKKYASFYRIIWNIWSAAGLADIPLNSSENSSRTFCNILSLRL